MKRGWRHPRDSRKSLARNGHLAFRPLHGGSFAEDKAEWECTEDEPFFATEWDYMPDWSEDEATHYQVYETVSEGTPVSPVFASLEKLCAWMQEPIDRNSPYNRGEDWQCMQGKTREQAERFCRIQYCPSAVVTGGVMYRNVETMDVVEDS